MFMYCKKQYFLLQMKWEQTEHAVYCFLSQQNVDFFTAKSLFFFNSFA